MGPPNLQPNAEERHGSPGLSERRGGLEGAVEAPI